MMALQAAEQPTAKEIWETLSKIDVSEHIERKGGLSYLSWAWAWGVLKDHYPQADYEFREWTVDIVPVSHVGPTIDCMIYADGSASVHCQVTIVDVAASMWLTTSTQEKIYPETQANPMNPRRKPPQNQSNRSPRPQKLLR